MHTYLPTYIPTYIPTYRPGFVDTFVALSVALFFLTVCVELAIVGSSHRGSIVEPKGR